MKKKEIWIKLIFFLIVFSSFSFNFINYNTNLENKKEFLKTSDNEISIITPENKTYTEPMSGYYLASYGFESDPLGLWHPPNPPFDNTILNPINMTIVKDQFGHKKVLKLIDCSAIDIVDLAYTVSPSDLDDGTIEFWWATNDTSKYGWHIFDLYRHVYPYSIGYMELNGGRFHMRTNTEFLDHSVIPQNNIWYHIRVDWSRYGGYQGLSARRYKVTIDGIEGPELIFNQNNNAGMRYIRFSTGSIEKDYEWYIDAVGVSTDINYNAGDNLNEGLLLSFANSTTLDWMGYSLDGLANKTIMGNTTLPLPANGAHNIQVFGNNSFGAMYASDLRYFTLNLPMINIITPVNKTYTEPMSGYYPATYGFENDKLYTLPQEWSEPAYYSPKTYVIPSLNGHHNVFQIYDDTSSHDTSVLNNFTAEQQFGAVELWCAVSDVIQATAIGINLRNEFNARGPSIGIRSGYFAYHDGVWRNIIPAISNQWYHIRMVFRCNNSPAYEGLSENCYYLYINQIKYGEFSFRNTGNDAVRIAIGVGHAAINNAYIDAVGYSWDPNYNIGDNLNEGLLLSFINRTTLDWMGYSLDGLANKTILGNTTLPLPANGTHNIQVFGNDSLGTMYASNLRYFTIDVPIISIITPENKTYTEPDNGYYPATYGFEEDQIGTSGTDITFIDSKEAGAVATIVAEADNHKNILRYSTPSDFEAIWNDLSDNQSTGTVEFWINCAETNERHNIIIRGPMGNRILFDFYSNGMVQYISYSVWHPICSYEANRWYHVKITFDCDIYGDGTNDWHLWIDGLNMDGGAGYGYDGAPMKMNQVIFQGTSGANFDIDAVGYSWDPNYNIGDNLNEGLLLSFINRTTLDWIGYSLDGLTNKTIMGDVTIPFLSNGPHSIQMFGNDTLGTIYESEIRYFSINVPPPSISIITPSNDEFYSNIAPSFSVSITAFYQITTWYTLDGGGTNITFTGSSGTLNQTEWDGQGEGPITIRFYVNDSFGRLNYAEITINKDITDPVITINSPLFGDQFTTMPPYFEISVVESNIDTMWYTIDGGLNNYAISQDTGYIDSGAWNSAPNGAITIRFYVRDKAGNIDYDDEIIQKNAPPYIPPDNSLIIIISVAIAALSIFIGILLILYIVLSRKRKYESDKFKEPKKPEIGVKPEYGYFVCRYCHNENHIKNNYCIYCGASLADFKPNNI
ncbi:MAG: hypothetical protein ACFE8T_06900 [Promethearchaeota archaeon]